MTRNLFIDMHMHSTASDGTVAPRELARMCKSVNLAFSALTDHDTIDGVSEYLDEAKEIGLNAISGIEFSTKYDGELHILGYGIDIHEKRLSEALAYLAQSRKNRTCRMVQKLQDNGIDISLERVQEIALSGVIGRPHIARALAEKGYAKDVEEAFQKFLSEGCVGYIERNSITSAEAITLIKGAGGVAVFAHPGVTNEKDPKALVAKLVSEGLGGIEAYYPEHSDKEVALYCALAREYGLFITCGSDFHGVTRKTSRINAETRGDLNLKKSVVQIFNIFG